MGTISRANVYDVLKNKPRDRVVIVKGERGESERRIIKRPEARHAEQFVDPTGNVVWLQLLKLGTLEGKEAIDRERGKRNRQGFVEYGRCPLKHGTAVREDAPRLVEEFEGVPEELAGPCRHDPVIHAKRGLDQIANEPCPHIQWLIADRREREEAKRNARATHIETPADIEKQKLAIAEQQLTETRETNLRIVQAIEQIAGQRAPATAPSSPAPVPSPTAIDPKNEPKKK